MRDNILNRLIKVIVEDLRPKKIILFGSRGKGTFSYNSDYDLAIDTKKIEFRKRRILKEKLNDMAGLHSIDIVFIKEVDKGFSDIILQTGKVIYDTSMRKNLHTEE